MEKKFRSSCPISSTLDVLGDKWSLLIIRDMLIMHKRTFKDFSSSDEGIASAILSARLKLLESIGLITKRKLPTNKKENIYLLTEKAIDLAPIVFEIAKWGDEHMKAYNTQLMSSPYLKQDRASVIETIKMAYREGVAEIAD